MIYREVVRIDEPEQQVGMTPSHRVRPLLPMGDWTGSDPFLALMEDWFPRGVFDKHPHRGIETVTYVIDGHLDHYDNRGNGGAIRAGEAQWMTAGRGLIHNEIPAEGVTAHTLQLWVNLPAADKLTEPRYQDLTEATVPVHSAPGARVRVFSGASHGVKSATRNHVPVTLLEITLDPGATNVEIVPADWTAFLLVLSGVGTVGAWATTVRAGQVVRLAHADADAELTVTATTPLRALLFAGRPLREPVVAHGPFVMNTREQIVQAYQDYRNGGFGPMEA